MLLLILLPFALPAVKEKLRLDPDSEIATTGVRVSLICPVSPRYLLWFHPENPFLPALPCQHAALRVQHNCRGHSAVSSALLLTSALLPQLVKMRLSVPCRAETCAHLQCFDAVFYLQMNEKKPTWMCPVCDKPAPYDQLIIDG